MFTNWLAVASIVYAELYLTLYHVRHITLMTLHFRRMSTDGLP